MIGGYGALTLLLLPAVIAACWWINQLLAPTSDSPGVTHRSRTDLGILLLLPVGACVASFLVGGVLDPPNTPIEKETLALALMAYAVTMTLHTVTVLRWFVRGIRPRRTPSRQGDAPQPVTQPLHGGREVTSTRIYIDIDGVLNAYWPLRPGKTRVPPRGPWPDYRSHDYISRDGRTLPICWSPTVVEKLRELDTRDDVEFIFTTMWEAESQVFAAFVGLPPWRWVPLNGRPDEPRGLISRCKREAIRRDCELAANEHLVLWVDDDLSPMDMHSFNDIGTTIRTTAVVGITPKNLAEIE